MRRKRVIIILSLIGVYFVFIKRYSPSEGTCIRYSESILGERGYARLYKEIQDTVLHWKTHRLLGWQSRDWTHSDRIDTVLCINKSQDKLITVILNRDIEHSDASQDDINWFYGVKIKGKWYFFTGPTMVILRGEYEQDDSQPLSFGKLHELAVEHIFRGYLEFSFLELFQSGSPWKIREEFFEHLDDGAYNTPGINKQEYEESWLRLNRENWSKIDTTHYDREK